MKELIYKSPVAPLELYKEEHGKYSLYLKLNIRVLTKDREYVFERLKEMEQKLRGKNI